MNYIYTLSDPETNSIRYVGKTNDLTKRYSFHINDKSRSYKVNWIKSLSQKGLKPIINVIEEVNSNWQEREKYWIKYYRENSNLTNLSDGGDGNPGFISATRKPIITYNLDGTFYRNYSSIAEAAKEFNAKTAHICYACKGKLKTCKDKIWRYKGEELNIDSLNEKRRPIIQLDKDGKVIAEFISITQAAKYFNCKAPAISRVLRGERKHFKKTQFKYKDIV